MFIFRLVFSFLLFFVGLSAYASPVIDSLLAVLPVQESTEAILTQSRLSEAYYQKGDVQLSRHYGLLAMSAAKKLQFCEGGGAGAFYYAFSYVEEDSFFIVAPQVAAYMDSCNHAYTCFLYHNLGDQQQRKGMYPEALSSLQAALRSSQASGQQFMEYQSLSMLAYVYDRLRELETALEWSQKALAKARAMGDSAWVAVEYGEMGSIYDLDKDYQAAIYFHQKAIKLAREVPDSSLLCAELNNLANTYRKTGAYKIAEALLREALAVAKPIASTSIQAVSQINLGDVLGKMGQKQAAFSFFEAGKREAEALGRVDLLMDHHQYRYDLHKRLGQFDSALFYYELNRAIKDTLFQEEKQKELSRLEVRFETEQKEQQIALQQFELAAKEQQNRQNLLLGGAVILLLLVSGTALFLRQQQRRRYEARLKDLELKSEKERISRDLHDNVGAQLTGVITKLNTLEMSQEGGEPSRVVSDTLSSLDTQMRETMDLLRDTIWAIHKEEVTIEGLGTKLRQYMSRYLEGIPKLTWELKLSGDTAQQLSPNKALGIFRILQEAIQNIVKHAEASQLKLELKAEQGLHISLTDDGIGFDPALASPEGHFGLQNMQDRAEELGAQFRLKSAPGEGTRLRLSIPTLDAG